MLVAGTMTAEELHAQEQDFREYKAKLIPPLYEQADVPHFSFAELLGIEWLHTMTRHAEACDLGMEMLGIRYRDWKEHRQKTAEAMLDYCDCRPDDMTAVLAVLDQDSQAGTILAQEVVKQKWALSDNDRGTLARVLGEHPFITSADYVAPNSIE